MQGSGRSRKTDSVLNAQYLVSGNPIQDLEYCGGAEEKKPSNVRFTSDSTFDASSRDIRLLRTLTIFDCNVNNKF